MSLVSTKTPIFDDIPSIQFFNGRLLSGEDMTTEQAWNAARRKLLGQALGSGVAFGLEVRKSEKSEQVGKPIVSVDPGLALNVDGATLSLAEPTDVSLAQIDEAEVVPSEFSTCQPTQYSAYVKSDGVYLLTLCPAMGTQGRAPVSGLANQEARCNRKYRREGVQFRLHQLNLTEAELADRNKLRNLVAYKCFNPDAWQAFVTDPFGAQDIKPKLLDGLLVPKLEESEVPLATIFWTTDGGIEYVDLWSVRRRLAIPPGDPVWLNHLGPWAAAESEARLQQLHMQLFELAARITTPATATAKTYLRYVPAVGMVPVIGSGSPRGFRHDAFFGVLEREPPRSINLADAIGLMVALSQHPPVDVQAADVLYLYWIRENIDAVNGGKSNQRYVLYSVRPIFPINETVRKCLLDVSDAYSGLLAKGRFVPADGVAPLRVVMQLSGLVHRIVQYALGGLGMLYMAKDNQLTALFQALYSSQKDLVAFLSSSALGSADVDNKALFATLVATQLDVDQGSTAPALKTAIQQQNIMAAVYAQNRITNIVLQESGEVTVGNLEVTYKGSTRGETLAINDTQPFVFLFRVSNKTNHALPAIQLHAEFVPPREGWTQYATVVDVDTGDAILTIPLAAFDPLKPNDPAATKLVGVAVNTPAGATNGNKGTLQLSAFVLPPIDVRDSDQRELSVGPAATQPAPATVAFTPESPVSDGDLTNATELVPIVLTFRFNFNVLEGPTTRDFRFQIEASAPANPWTLFGVRFEPNEVGIDDSISGPATKISKVFPMTDGSLRTLRVKLTPRAGSKDHTLEFKVKVESVTDGIEAEIIDLSMIVKLVQP